MEEQKRWQALAAAEECSLKDPGDSVQGSMSQAHVYCDPDLCRGCNVAPFAQKVGLE